MDELLKFLKVIKMHDLTGIMILETCDFRIGNTAVCVAIEKSSLSEIAEALKDSFENSDEIIPMFKVKPLVILKLVLNAEGFNTFTEYLLDRYGGKDGLIASFKLVEPEIAEEKEESELQSSDETVTVSVEEIQQDLAIEEVTDHVEEVLETPILEEPVQETCVLEEPVQAVVVPEEQVQAADEQESVQLTVKEKEQEEANVLQEAPKQVQEVFVATEPANPVFVTKPTKIEEQLVSTTPVGETTQTDSELSMAISAQKEKEPEYAQEQVAEKFESLSAQDANTASQFLIEHVAIDKSLEMLINFDYSSENAEIISKFLELVISYADSNGFVS